MCVRVRVRMCARIGVGGVVVKCIYMKGIYMHLFTSMSEQLIPPKVWHRVDRLTCKNFIIRAVSSYHPFHHFTDYHYYHQSLSLR